MRGEEEEEEVRNIRQLQGAIIVARVTKTFESSNQQQMDDVV